MAKSKSATILLIGTPNRRQANAAATVTPGHLLQINTTGTVQVHGTAAGRHARLFAVENDFAGDGITHPYTVGEALQYQASSPGEQINAILANGQTAVIGSYLVSAGDGTLTVADANSAGVLEGSLVGMAMEAVDLSGSDAVDPSNRINVLII